MNKHPALLTPVAAQATTTPQRQQRLFDHHSLHCYQHGAQQAIELVVHAMQQAQAPSSGILPQALAERFRAVDLTQPKDDMQQALAELKSLYLQDAVYFHHPRYMAHLNCPVTVPSLVAEIIASALNTAVETWDQSGGATFIEQKLIDWSAVQIGFDGQADGVFTSGGSQSNLMALLMAREQCCQRKFGISIKQAGLPADFSKLRIFSSQMSHFSVQKSAAILGLGYDAVITVPCDRYFQMDFQALQQQVTQALNDGLIPMAVVATAGTTDFGSIDPMAAIARLCTEHDIWLHVDAAYGGGLLISPKYRHWLNGIELADSVTIDYHKSFFQPVSCSALIAKHRRTLAAVTYHAEYLNPLSQTEQGTPNLVNKSLQTTRRFDALKLWLTLRTLGAAQLGQLLDQVIHLTRQAYLLCLSEPQIEVIHQPQLSTLVFRYIPQQITSLDDINQCNQFIRQQLHCNGEAMVAATKIAGVQYLKFTLLNPNTSINEIRQVLQLILQHGSAWFSQQCVATTTARNHNAKELCHA